MEWKRALCRKVNHVLPKLNVKAICGQLFPEISQKDQITYFSDIIYPPKWMWIGLAERYLYQQTLTNVFDTFSSSPSVQACWTLCCQRTVLSMRKRSASPSGSRTRILCSEANSGRTLSSGGFLERWQSGQNQAWSYSSSIVVATQLQWKISRQSSHCTMAPEGAFWQTQTLSAQQFSAGTILDSFEARRANNNSNSVWRTSARVANCREMK